MKKKMISLLLAVLFCFAFCACGKTENISLETAVGKTLSLPTGAGVVLSCDDSSVQISNGLFVASAAGTYTVKSKVGNKTTEITVTVKAATRPVINVDDFTVHTSGTVTLPLAECFDACGESAGYTVSVKKGDAEVSVTDGKITAEAGEYTLLYECIDGYGNKATKQTTLLVRDSDFDKACYMPLETKWGSEQFFRNYNLKNGYSTEIKYDGEAGATKISFTADRDPWAGFIFTKNVLIPDISEYSKMVFHIYNDSEYTLFFNPNWVSQKGYELRPKQWNTVELGTSMLKESSRNTQITDRWETDAANALAIIFADYNNLMPRFDVYFGNIYLV